MQMKTKILLTLLIASALLNAGPEINIDNEPYRSAVFVGTAVPFPVQVGATAQDFATDFLGQHYDWLVSAVGADQALRIKQVVQNGGYDTLEYAILAGVMITHFKNG